MNQMVVVPPSTPSVPFSDMEKMAAVVAKSGLFGIRDPNQALALMMLSQAEGVHPMLAARDYHIINGQPSMRADAMLARYQAVGGVIEWLEYSDERCAATFQIGKSKAVTVEWDKARAQQAGLLKNPMYAKFPRQMLSARVISEGVRKTAPGVCAGIYTPEEADDFRVVALPREEPVAQATFTVEPTWTPADRAFKNALEDIKTRCMTRKDLKVVAQSIKTGQRDHGLTDEHMTVLRAAYAEAEKRIKAAEKAEAEKIEAEKARRSAAVEKLLTDYEHSPQRIQNYMEELEDQLIIVAEKPLQGDWDVDLGPSVFTLKRQIADAEFAIQTLLSQQPEVIEEGAA